MRTYTILVMVLVLIAGSVYATVAPKNGASLPQAYFDRIAADRTAFTTQRAWVQKTQRIKQQREEFLMANGPMAVEALPSELMVTGNFYVPVLLARFANVTAPYAYGALQNQLFSNPSGTVTDYYDEVSYGNLNLTGTVYNWVSLIYNDTYYEGLANGLDTTSHMGSLLKETLDANDASVNFGLYDNDGPDGIPNSGDDDGYVDVVAFVHAESGGECGGSNIWSHRWFYRGWPESGGLAYTTNDPAAGGGFIKVDDYSIQPALSCASGMIEIGVFCHEFGHGFGLPDLYDTNGPGHGIGWWGIMGTGNWNTPSSPAHPCAWTRKEMGWLIPTDVTWQGSALTINQINTNAQAYRLAFTDDRFRRGSACAITGTYSLYCGLTATEATQRGWYTPGPGGGYGNWWDETVEREFNYSGSGSVTFSYQYDYDTEFGYDYAYSLIEVGGVESVLATYTGTGSGTANIGLTSYLGSLSPGGGKYKLKFRATSDRSWSDEDGDFDSNCGLIAVDNVSVTGGGESYSTGFETYADGWHQAPAENDPTEYWLVENRQRVGFDANLIQPGLLIMHVEDQVANGSLGNTGGSGSTTRGLVVEEADGLFNLIGGTINRGDTGDPYPGSTNKRTFNSATTPNSNDNQYRTTQIEVSSISNSGPAMTAFMKAGDLAPAAVSVLPNDIDNDQVAVPVVITGSRIKHGATFYFTNPTGTVLEATSAGPMDALDIPGASIEWVDPVRLLGTINVYSKQNGYWDLVVTNPDGRTFTLDNAIHINYIVATQLTSASNKVVGGRVYLYYELRGREEGETIRLYRSVLPDAAWEMIASDFRPEPDGRYTYVDGDVEPGRTYYYRLESRLADGDVRELHRGSATIPARELTMSQNYPNPFNPSTSISFYLPERSKLSLDVFDVSGRLVRRIASGVFSAGPHQVSWNGTDSGGNTVGSGVYVYRLTSGKRTISKKMILLK